MNFVADKQTTDDLNILGKYKPDSIYKLFQQVVTAGGERLLDSMFQSPLTDPDAINDRSAIFSYFQRKALDFPFDRATLDTVENFLGAGGGAFLATMAGTIRRRLLESIVRDEAYARTKAGLLAAIRTLKLFFDFMARLGEDGENSPFAGQVAESKILFNDSRLGELQKETPDDLGWLEIARYDHLLRKTLRKEMETVIGIITQLDVYMSVSRIAAVKGFSYARALPRSFNTFQAVDLRHPRLENGIGNPLSFHLDNNMLFLTGANMAGKSTLMKAFGISVYLAHMGFPVAAESLTFSVKDGIWSSINVPDNLNLGHSHFYAEVLRVKKVAEEVGAGKDLVVIFDELFKGTNVKDAYDATLAVTAALAQYRYCFFVISTHIIEVGTALKENGDNIQFSRLPTTMDGTKPHYSFRLEEGITDDRHGMMIIRNERILDIIRSPAR
jgi:DNA mismatch repair ATPase MutS